jgi:hypothetical protein
MTKPVIAVGMLRLVDQGRVGLDDPVSKYIPSFADAKVFAGERRMPRSSENWDPSQTLPEREKAAPVHRGGFLVDMKPWSRPVRCDLRRPVQQTAPQNVQA